MFQAARKRKPLSQLTNEEASVTRKKSRGEDARCVQKRAGTINYIILKNFMCHSLLQVKFDNNIAIIIGKNGSGKSAVLTGLIIGLGGKATLTNRGSSIKGFIKAGKTSATIEIQLHNEGPMAYRPNVYGKTINIIRNLNISGGSTYRIRSDAGEVISTQAKELGNITTNLNIQIDNPVCLLNQDTSRNFLSSNDPKNKFLLFMKATKLETLEAEYKKIKDNRRDSLASLQEKEMHFRKLQDDIKKMKRKMESHKSILSLKDKKKLLQIELVWAKVRDSEHDLQEKNTDIECVKKKIQEFQEKVKSVSKHKYDIEESNQQLEIQVSEIKKQIYSQNKPKEDLKQVLSDLRRNYSNISQEKQKLTTIINSKLEDSNQLEQEISEAKTNMSKMEQLKIQHMRSISELQDKLKGIDDILETSRNDLFQIKTDVSRKQEELENLNQEINSITFKIDEENRNIKMLEMEKNNELLLYGKHMPKLKEVLKQYEQQFDHLPRGPLGAYIKLKDKKWAVAVEGYLGSQNLNSFTVHSLKDSQLLRQILDKVWPDGQQPTVIISKFVFKKHDVSSNLVQAPPDCISLYAAINIEDPIVLNCVIDQCTIEGILLIPDDTRAIELLSSIHNVPKNCIRGLTIKGDNYYPDPNYKTYASKYHVSKYLQVDTSEYVTVLKQNTGKLTMQKHCYVRQLKALQQDIQSLETRKNELEEKIKKILLAKSKLKRQYEELSNEAVPEVQNIHYLEKELDEIQKILVENNEKVNRISEEVKALQLKIADTEEKIQHLKNSSTDMESRIETLQEQIRENQVQLREMLSSSNFAERKIQDYEKKIHSYEAEIALKKNIVKKYTLEASVVGERLQNLRNVIEISQDISDVEKSIARIETDTENVADLIEKYNSLHEKYKTAFNILKNINQDVQELNKAVERRNRHYKLTESYFITFIKHSFKKILEFRQFKGNIIINMDEKKLELNVIPQHGSQGLSSTCNLSGGEKSFSTVAFLYSLWQCMEFPFYFLDEFDVYMDKLNRTKVIEILLHHAKSRPELQFVFLTPQDVSFINPEVSILRLQDPERQHGN